MCCYRRSKQYEEKSEQPVFSHKDCTVQKSQPDHTDRDNLYLQWYRFMDHEIPDVWSQFRVIEQPMIQIHIPSKE